MLTMGFSIARRNEIIKWLAEGVLKRALEHALGGIVEHDDLLLVVDRDNRIHRGFDDALEPELAEHVLLFGPLSASNRAHHGSFRVGSRFLCGLHQPFGVPSLHTF
jgi:hypothetical protein